MNLADRIIKEGEDKSFYGEFVSLWNIAQGIKVLCGGISSFGAALMLCILLDTGMNLAFLGAGLVLAVGFEVVKQASIKKGLKKGHGILLRRIILTFGISCAVLSSFSTIYSAKSYWELKVINQPLSITSDSLKESVGLEISKIELRIKDAETQAEQAYNSMLWNEKLNTNNKEGMKLLNAKEAKVTSLQNEKKELKEELRKSLLKEEQQGEVKKSKLSLGVVIFLIINELLIIAAIAWGVYFFQRCYKERAKEDDISILIRQELNNGTRTNEICRLLGVNVRQVSEVRRLENESAQTP